MQVLTRRFVDQKLPAESFSRMWIPLDETPGIATDSTQKPVLLCPVVSTTQAVSFKGKESLKESDRLVFLVTSALFTSSLKKTLAEARITPDLSAGQDPTRVFESLFRRVDVSAMIHTALDSVSQITPGVPTRVSVCSAREIVSDTLLNATTGIGDRYLAIKDFSKRCLEEGPIIIADNAEQGDLETKTGLLFSKLWEQGVGGTRLTETGIDARMLHERQASAGDPSSETQAMMRTEWLGLTSDVVVVLSDSRPYLVTGIGTTRPEKEKEAFFSLNENVLNTLVTDQDNEVPVVILGAIGIQVIAVDQSSGQSDGHEKRQEISTSLTSLLLVEHSLQPLTEIPLEKFTVKVSYGYTDGGKISSDPSIIIIPSLLLAKPSTQIGPTFVPRRIRIKTKVRPTEIDNESTNPILGISHVYINCMVITAGRETQAELDERPKTGLIAADNSMEPNDVDDVSQVTENMLVPMLENFSPDGPEKAFGIAPSQHSEFPYTGDNFVYARWLEKVGNTLYPRPDFPKTMAHWFDKQYQSDLLFELPEGNRWFVYSVEQAFPDMTPPFGPYLVTDGGYLLGPLRVEQGLSFPTEIPDVKSASIGNPVSVPAPAAIVYQPSVENPGTVYQAQCRLIVDIEVTLYGTS